MSRPFPIILVKPPLYAPSNARVFVQKKNIAPIMFFLQINAPMTTKTHDHGDNGKSSLYPSQPNNLFIFLVAEAQKAKKKKSFLTLLYVSVSKRGVIKLKVSFPAHPLDLRYIINILPASFSRSVYCKLRILFFLVDLWPVRLTLGP